MDKTIGHHQFVHLFLKDEAGKVSNHMRIGNKKKLQKDRKPYHSANAALLR